MYFKEVLNRSGIGAQFFYDIKWNVNEIAGYCGANGYIVQHVKWAMHIEPDEAREKLKIRDMDYYEAWKVSKGKIQYGGSTNGYEFDDRFSVSECSYFKTLSSPYFECANSIGTSGKYTVDGDVYWIEDDDAKLFATIEKWEPGGIKAAGKLKSSKVFPELDNRTPVFTRPTIEHSWSLKSETEIESKVSGILFKFCYNKEATEQRNTDILNMQISAIFDDAPVGYKEIGNRIIRTWKETYYNDSILI